MESLNFINLQTLPVAPSLFLCATTLGLWFIKFYRLHYKHRACDHTLCHRYEVRTDIKCAQDHT